MARRLLLLLLFFPLTTSLPFAARPAPAPSAATTRPPIADERPLPELTAFLREARARIGNDQELQRQYTFRERRREIKISKLGKVSTGRMEVFEVYPGAWPVRTYRRLVEIDGTPRPAEEIARDDREHRQKVEEALERGAKESPAARAKRLERRAKDQREFQRTVDDLFRVYRFTMAGREPVDGHSTIVIDFEPRPDAQPLTDGGRLMRKVRGRAWIAEDDYQIARIDGESLEDFSFGWGIFGKVYKGTTATFERRKINRTQVAGVDVRFNLAPAHMLDHRHQVVDLWRRQDAVLG